MLVDPVNSLSAEAWHEMCADRSRYFRLVTTISFPGDGGPAVPSHNNEVGELEGPQGRWLRDVRRGLWVQAPVWDRRKILADVRGKDVALALDDRARSLVPGKAHVETDFEEGVSYKKFTVRVYDQEPDASHRLRELCGL